MKISVVGLGYVGLPLSSLLARDFEVIGYDNDHKKISSIEAGIEVVIEPGLPEIYKKAIGTGMLKLTSEISDIKDTKVKIITVGTPFHLETSQTDFSQLDSSLEKIVPNLNKGDIIILKSTVPPGTTMERVKGKVESAGFSVPDDIGLVFSPERMVEGQAVRDFLTLPKIIGSTDEKSKKIARKILSTLGGTIVEVSSPTVAEMAKMVDNYSRFVFIALTNEIALMSEKIGVDVMELITAAKTDYPRNAGLMKPGPGVGGSCLNKDPFIMQSFMMKRNLELKMVEAAKEINYGMGEHISDLIRKFSSKRRNVAILGVAFKGDTNDIRFTTSFSIYQSLVKSGFQVTLSDPFVQEQNGEIIRDAYAAVRGADILLLLTDHSEYAKLDLIKIKGEMKPHPLIIDARAVINRTSAERIGFEYHGLGRL